MPGMGNGFQSNNPTMEAAFRAAVQHQSVAVILLALLLALAYAVTRTIAAHRLVSPGSPRPRQSATSMGAAPSGEGADATAVATTPPPVTLQASRTAEPTARRFLRIAFGCLWIFDGLLQLQAQMPIGLATQVISPTEAGQPHWLALTIQWGTGVWERHPVEAAAAAVWIQIGIGAWLLVAARGRWSRLGGLASVGWALVVWVFGEGMGMVLTPSGSWLFGAPGAVVFYGAAGALLAMGETVWYGPGTGRRILRFFGVVFLGGAVLQALPGRGSWNGNSLSSMAAQMSSARQPHLVASLVNAFGNFAAANGLAVNVFVIVALSAVGLGLLTQRLVHASFIGAIVMCAATWVLVQDCGFFGGIGTDPNSGIPMILLLSAGYLALRRATVMAEAGVVATRPAGADRLGGAPGRNPLGLEIIRWLSIAAAVGVTILGAAPMALASLNPRTDLIVAESISGSTTPQNSPEFGFTLIDQNGRPVSLRGLRGRAVLLTFLDPVCTSDCPLIAQELKAADGLLGANAARVEIVAVVANPLFRSIAVVQAFDRQEGLNHLTNWLFLTGSVPRLQHVWNDYGIEVQVAPGGSMVAHNDEALVIDPNGRIRWFLSSDPGPGTATTQSSFASLFAGCVSQVLNAGQCP